MKGIEHLFNIRLVFEEINPAKTRIVVDKTHIIICFSAFSNVHVGLVCASIIRTNLSSVPRCVFSLDIALCIRGTSA